MKEVTDSERKDVTNDQSPFRKITRVDVEESIKGITFPADKNEIVEYAIENDTRDAVINMLSEFTDKEYRSVIEIAMEFDRFDGFLQKSYQGGIVGETKVREWHEDYYEKECYSEF